MKPTVIEPMAVTRLRPFPGNPRTHSKKQIRQIAGSIARFGFTTPVLIGDDNEVIAGHGRLEAAKLLGRKSVPTLRLSGLDAAERRAYALADNKLALNARWDRGALAVELTALADVQFDAEVTGFSCAEIELVLEGAPENCRRASETAVCSPSPASGGGSGRGPLPRACAVERSPSLPSTACGGGEGGVPPAAVTRRDDFWLIDRHRVWCADPFDPAAMDHMLGGDRLVFVAFEPALCDRIVHRFRHLTGQDATLAATGQSFADVAAQRQTETPR